jgi:1-acyl-sn-glycerol-3-phosphate acyltransferase
VIVRVARVRVNVEGSAEAEAALDARERPVIVLCTHAGEGDSLLAVHELLCRHGRRPRVVMHEVLRLDPLIDVLGDRLPNRFLDPRGGDTEREIEAMATGLGSADALLIFPEGANFSAEHRRCAIERLRSRGHTRHAAQAEAMAHLSAPRPGGVLAALDGAPEADVVLMAHAGFPRGVADTWRQLPHVQTVRMRLWLARAETIPAAREARIAWLFERWADLDAWVGAASGRMSEG